MAPEAWAPQAIATSCRGQFVTQFGVGPSICVTGDVDYEAPGTNLVSAGLWVVAKGGVSEFVDASGPKK